jgi:hypothetical protein
MIREAESEAGISNVVFVGVGLGVVAVVLV